MITRFATLSSRLAVALTFLLTIAACGGGGGSGGDFLSDGDSSGGTYFLTLTLLGPDGEPTNTVTSAAPAKFLVKVTKKNKNGAPVSGVVVTTTTTIGAIIPPSGTALSDSEGIARFQIAAGTAKGAGTITSTAEAEDGAAEATFAFQVGASGLRLGYFDQDNTFIENEIGIEPRDLLLAQGRAQLALAIVDEEGRLARSVETVRISSGCLTSGQATLDPVSPIVTANGAVNVTYTPSGCAGVDEITASITGASSQAFGDLAIAPPQATALTFVSAEPRTIVLRGTGGGPERQTSSKVVFQVVDSTGAPVSGVNVDFSLTTFAGGLSLSPKSGLSASDGTVGTTVFSGDVATVVRVIASAAADDSDQTVSTVSDVLTVSTGLPDQRSMSLSVAGGFVVENGFTVDGIERTITVRMADRFKNPVTNGTAAVFTTEYGTIDPSCETGIKNGERLTGTPEEGACSVKWTSGSPRFPTLEENRDAIKTIFSPGYSCPSHNGSSGPCPDDLGYTRGGRSTVTVTAIGQESFVDSNGNGIMDQSEKDDFDNLPEAFYDYNEDGVYTREDPACQGSGASSSRCIAGSEEEFKDFNSNLAYDFNDNPALYNGLLCPPEGDGNWCSRELLNVRDSTILILSADPQWDIILVRGSQVVSGTTEGSTYTAYISDLYNSRPPAGSTIKVDADGECELASEDSFDVANSAAPGAVGITVATAGDGGAGTVSITLTPKGGASYTETFSCQSLPDAPEDPNEDGGLTVGG